MKTGSLPVKKNIFLFFLLSVLLAGCNQNLIQPVGSVRTSEKRLNPKQTPSPALPHRPAFQSHPKYALVGSFSTGERSYVRSLLADKNAVWVGTTEGVIQVSTRSGDAIQTFTMQDGLISPYIFTMNKSPDGIYWFGTNNGGLSRFDGKTFINYNTEDGLADRWVYALSIDGDGSIWFGTEGGVSRLGSDGQWKSWDHRDGLGAPNKLGLAKSDNTGFGTLSKIEAEEYKHNHNLSVLAPDGNETYNENYVFSMEIDRSGHKWFGTWGGGVSRFDGIKWQNFTTEDGLAGNIVYAVTVDPHDGALWFGTNHGVSRFDGQTWTSMMSRDGLANENVYAIAIDSERRIWLGEKGGVDVWAPR